MRSSARLLVAAVATAGIMAVGSPAFASGYDCPDENGSSEVDRPSGSDQQSDHESADNSRETVNADSDINTDCIDADIAVAVLSCNSTKGDANGLLGGVLDLL